MIRIPTTQFESGGIKTKTFLASPRHHLFHQMGLPVDAIGTSPCRQRLCTAARGITRCPFSSKIRRQNSNDSVHKAADAAGIGWKQSSTLVLQRRQYIVAAGLGLSRVQPDRSSFTVTLSIFLIQYFPCHPPLPYHPGTRALLLNLQSLNRAQPQVLAASANHREQSSKNV